MDTGVVSNTVPLHAMLQWVTDTYATLKRMSGVTWAMGYIWRHWIAGQRVKTWVILTDIATWPSMRPAPVSIPSCPPGAPQPSHQGPLSCFQIFAHVLGGKWHLSAIFVLFYIYLFFNWRIIALQNFVVFCQTSTWISHRYTYIFSLLNLPPISLPILPL